MIKEPGVNLSNGTKKKPPPQTAADPPASGPASARTPTHKPPLPELMRFKECAADGNVCVKTITRWVDKGLLTEWRPHPESRTRRIKRNVWEAFKHRNKSRP